MKCDYCVSCPSPDQVSAAFRSDQALDHPRNSIRLPRLLFTTPVLSLFVLLMLQVPAISVAQWSDEGVAMFDSIYALGSFPTATVPDDQGGMWAVMGVSQYYGLDRIRVQHIDSEGFLTLPFNGINLAGGQPGDSLGIIQGSFVNDVGGIDVVYTTCIFNDPYRWTLYWQRIDAEGNRPWGDIGRQIDSTIYEQFDEVYNLAKPHAISDGQGGVWAVYLGDISSPPNPVILCGMNADGTQKQIENHLISTEVWNTAEFRIFHDGNGGVFLLWGQYVDGFPYEMYQHVSYDGTVAFDTPRILSEYTSSSTYLLLDGEGGFYYSTPMCINRISADDSRPWGYDQTDFLSVVARSGPLVRFFDGTIGFLRVNSYPYELRQLLMLVRVWPDGTPFYDSLEVPVFQGEELFETNPVLPTVVDQEARRGISAVLGAFHTEGSPGWHERFQIVCSNSANDRHWDEIARLPEMDPERPLLNGEILVNLSDGSVGFTLRDLGNTDDYRKRLLAFRLNFQDAGLSGEYLSNQRIPSDMKLTIHPNPFNGSVIFEINSTAKSPAQIVVFDLLGRKIIQSEIVLQAGRNRVPWSMPPHLSSAVYLVRIGNLSTNETIQERIMHLK